MSKIKQGILGPVSGKVGNVVGGTWKGVDYLRSLPANVTNPRTEAQLSQRLKFIAMVAFLQPMTQFLKIGFKGYARNMSGYNAAMSYNLRNAIAGIYPTFEINYPQVLVARGSLPVVFNLAASSPAANELQVTWSDNSTMHNAGADDKVMVLVHNPADKGVFFNLDAARRADGTLSLTLPSDWQGGEVHVWVALTNLPDLIVAGNNTTISNSAYAGLVLIS